VLWWPSRSSAMGTTIHSSGSSFIVDFFNLLSLYIKSRDDSFVTANLVLAEWFQVRNLEPKLCTSIPPLLNPTFGSWTWRIVDGTIFIWSWMVNPNGAAWFRPHNPATTVFDNHEWCHNNPPPPPLPMFSARATELTSFMNEDCASLMNFCRFVVPNEPNCLLCRVYDDDGNVCHPSQNCPLLLDGFQCFKCLESHLRSDCPNSIPRSPDSLKKFIFKLEFGLLLAMVTNRKKINAQFKRWIMTFDDQK
jgi:hypothetical protein